MIIMACLLTPKLVHACAPDSCCASDARAPNAAVRSGSSLEFSSMRLTIRSTTPALTSAFAAGSSEAILLMQLRAPIFSVRVTCEFGADNALTMRSSTPRLESSGPHIAASCPSARNPARRAYSRSFVNVKPSIVCKASTTIPAAFFRTMTSVLPADSAKAPTVAIERASLGRTESGRDDFLSSATRCSILSISASTLLESSKRLKRRAPMLSIVSDQGYASIAKVVASTAPCFTRLLRISSVPSRLPATRSITIKARSAGRSKSSDAELS
mmetsp:Transcript_15437/g.29905  ORF Transcript_15437/g.29905 Transcript_15437/m.29905 type:complete len:271 (-) Transcript_15437:658-1470(-)